MKSAEIRQRFLQFFEKRGHAIVPSASLVPENDPSVLFTTAGMQPLVPYLLGQKHPAGDRLVNVQKCVRTGDLDDIGDNRHFSFFEMMGNWSLGSYFKQEAISWSYEFLTSEEEGLGLDPNRLYVTCFEGDDPSTPEALRTGAPRDEESPEIWKSLGIPEHRIYFLGANDNWWSPGDNGPCGPDSEMFYDMTEQGLGDLSKEEFLAAQEREDIIEIWNDVFMEYEKRDGKVIGKLAQKNVDTGAGLERITAVMQSKKTAYDTDIFERIFTAIDAHLSSKDDVVRRIIADHARTSVLMVKDGVVPSNKDRGYVLRRLIRRMYYRAHTHGMGKAEVGGVIDAVIDTYAGIYVEHADAEHIRDIILEECAKFETTLEKGIKEFEKGTDPFILATTYGFPIELTTELAREQGKTIDLDEFNKKMGEHQELSRSSAGGMFKGGLGDHSEATVKLHTAHHLLLAALQKHVSPNIKQRGSNITPERLRIDFSFDRKLTDEEKIAVETQVNDWIQAGLSVVRREMPLAEAEKLGAEMEFGAKYPDVVSVYFVEDENDQPISKEFCGGPHVENTSVLGTFKLQKEEASSAGVRRIKAVLS